MFNYDHLGGCYRRFCRRPTAKHLRLVTCNSLNGQLPVSYYSPPTVRLHYYYSKALQPSNQEHLRTWRFKNYMTTRSSFVYPISISHRQQNSIHSEANALHGRESTFSHSVIVCPVHQGSPIAQPVDMHQITWKCGSPLHLQVFHRAQTMPLVLCTRTKD